MRRHGYGISVFGAIVLCCLFFCFPAQSDDNAVSIRVGYYEDGDYMSRGRSAEYIVINHKITEKEKRDNLGRRGIYFWQECNFVAEYVIEKEWGAPPF